MSRKPSPVLRRKRPATAKRPAAPDAPFPIVGIGASAGGLEALELFLRSVPPASGLAFVVVQHLDPTHRGILSELLQRTTAMKVMQVKDRTPVKPDCVYVIPPNRDMSLLHGVLHLLAPTAPRGLRLPIDFFFRSLAQDQQERGIGVILSGMGTDGTLGLRALKEKAGLVLVQDPGTARFDGMPRSAIDAGLADLVAPVEDLPRKIIAFLTRGLPHPSLEPALEEKTRSALEKAVILLRAHTGHDFTHYKRNTLYRRIERRMAIHQIPKMSGYVRYLQQNPQEKDLLFKELLIGVTNFFRDSAAWVQLRDEAIPALLATRTPGQTLRAWVLGCSSGEEAYSLAMVFREAVEASRHEVNFALQIFATDLDQDAINKARQGIYPENIIADVSPARLKRFFFKETRGYRVRKEIRDMVTFAPQNLVMDAPFTKLDLLTCRNLLIYLTAEVQKKLIPLFHYSLNAGGILFLGIAETTGTASDLFAPLGGKSRIFRRKETAPGVRRVEFPASFSAGLATGAPARLAPKTAESSLQVTAEQLVLQRYSPPAVLTNDKGDICYITGRTGKYLEPAAGKANWNLFAMAREGLRHELSAGFQRSLRQGEAVVLHRIPLGTDAGDPTANVSIQHLDDPGPLQGLVMVVFTEAPPSAFPEKAAAGKPAARSPNARTAEMERELVRIRAEARTAQEEMQTSQEELRSANEELQSTNEELQSTNEEMTTSKEEMQSLNEELQTVNAELQTKVDELLRTSNDMKNLLNSTDIATLFLDNQLNIRRFTPQAAKIIKLLPADEGRPITDLASALHYPGLTRDAREVLRTLDSIEKPISSHDARWFTVRIMPYRTLDDRIDGVVITFADITTAKTLETKLRNRSTSLEKQAASQTRRLKKHQRGPGR